MGNTYLERLGQLTHEVANYLTGESPESTPPTPEQHIREAQADTLPTLSTGHESSHSMDGYLRVAVALDVPGQGADRNLPILTYRDPTHYPFSWSPPLYTIFGPNAGRAHINSQFNIHSGSVSLTGNLAHIQGLDFRNLGRGDGTTLPNEGDLPWLPNMMDPQGVWRRHPYNLTYVPLELSRNDEGNLLMPGQVRTEVLGAIPLVGKATLMGHTVADNYPTLLLWREGIPYGVNAQGALVCSESERNTVVRPFPTLTHLREGGLPPSLDLATLAAISEEAGPYQRQLLDDTLHNRCGSTRLRFNLPASMEENPLAFVPAASVEAHLASGPTTIDIPGNGQHHRPSVEFDLNSLHNQLDAEVTLRNGNSSRPTDRNNLTWTRAQARVRGFLSLSRIRVGNQALELPLTLEANLSAEGTGELAHPETVGAHLVADGQVTANGNILINQRLADLFNLPLDIPEILFFRNGPTYAMARGIDLTVSPGTHAIQMRGAASVGVGLSSIAVPLLGIQTGPISANMYLHGTDQAIVADIAAHAVLPHVAFPAPLSATLERGWLSIPHLQVWLGQGASLHNFTAGIRGNIEVGNISASVQGNHIEMGQAGLRVEGQAHVQEGLVDASVHFDAAVPNMRVQASGNHSLDARLRLDASGDLRIYDSPFEDTHGQNIVRRHIEATGIRMPFDLGIRGLPLANNIHIHGNDDTMADGSPARLGHAMIPAGVQITSDLHPGESLIGRHSRMTINRRVSNLIISTPLGRFRVSGQLVGQSDLVNISQDPRQPQLRPVVGGMLFEVRNGTVADEQGHTFFRDRIFRIRDNGRGQITVSDANQISLNGIPESIRNLFWLPESVSNVLEIPVVNFNAGAVRNSSVPEPFSRDPVSRDTGAVSYYEPSQIREVSIPSAVLRSVLNNMGTLVTTAQARITGLQSDHTRVSYRTRTPIHRIHRDINDETHHVRGRVTLLGGQMETQGTGTHTNFGLQLPQLQINVRHEINGISCYYKGILSPRDRNPIVGQTHLNPLTLDIPERTHELTGDLHVTATRPTFSQEERPAILGYGRVHVTAPFIFFGRVNQGRATFTARIPDIHIEGRSLQAVHQGEIQIPAGPNLDLHLEGFEANLEAHLPHRFQELRTRRGN